MLPIWKLATLAVLAVQSTAANFPDTQQKPLKLSDNEGGISENLFFDLDRLSHLVDITYCIGTSGIQKPFQCVSRCKEFPELQLVQEWHTGQLKTDSCGFIAVDHGGPRLGQDTPTEPAIYIAFRGTYSITNWIIDLSTVAQEYVPYSQPGDDDDPKNRCTNCTVHSGFLASWKTARSIIIPELEELRVQHPDYPLRLVGHSLGGAVAALAALELKVVFGYENLVATTFGEPRVGNEGFAEFVDNVFDLNSDLVNPESRVFRRVTHTQDPVPLLPFTEWNYFPHAGEIFISKDELEPMASDLMICKGDADGRCSIREDDTITSHAREAADMHVQAAMWDGRLDVPSRWKLWELLHAHRDYFVRIGLCTPSF